MSVMQRQIDYRRSARANNAAQTRIRRPLLSPDVPFSFSARMGVNDSGAPAVKMFKGYRQTIGSDPVLCAPGSGDEFSFDFTDGHKVWTVFTYRTTESGSGTWDSTLQHGTTPPAENHDQRVVIIAEMVDVSGSPRVIQRHFGDIAVYDILNRSACS